MSNTVAEAYLEKLARSAITKDLPGNLGPVVLGFAFDLVLFGVMLHQMVVYLGTATNERPFISVIVTYVTACATAHTCHLIYYMWSNFVSGFGTYSQFVRIGSSNVITVFIVLTIFPVQIFYLERAYRLLNKSKWILVVVSPLLVTSWASGIGLLVAAFRIELVTQIRPVLPWFYVYDLSVVVADLIITGSIIVGLRRSQTGWSHTDHVVRQLIRLSYQASLACTIAAIIILVNFAARSDSLLNRFWTMWFSKVYVVSLYAVLNSRSQWRHDGTSTGQTATHDNTFTKGTRLQQQTVQFDVAHADTRRYSESRHGEAFQLDLVPHSDGSDDAYHKAAYSSTTALRPAELDYNSPSHA